MTVSQQLQALLSQAMDVQHLELKNESHMHAGPATDSHYKLVLVSQGFEGLPRVKRHQLVYRAVAELLQAQGGGPLHALALHLYTPAEWSQAQVPESPQCEGKNK